MGALVSDTLRCIAPEPLVVVHPVVRHCRAGAVMGWALLRK
jgi:hypothetical protein